MDKHSNARCEYGSVFGLSPTDLTDDQLQKINFDKLVEFLDIDARTEKIAGDKLLIEKTTSFGCLKNADEEFVAKHPYIVEKYNEKYKNKKGELDKDRDSYYSYRSSYISWELLDIESRRIEYKRRIEGKESIVNDDNVDYHWLYESEPILADELVKKILEEGKKNRYGSTRALANLVRSLPEHKINDYVSTIFTMEKDVYLHALSNKFLPEEYIVKALKVAAKRFNVPQICAPITESVLNKLPTVTRLEAVETILFRDSKPRGSYYRRSYNRPKTLPFVDMTEEKLKALLFGNLVRHTQRVERAVEEYRIITKPPTTTNNV